METKRTHRCFRKLPGKRALLGLTLGWVMATFLCSGTVLALGQREQPPSEVSASVTSLVFAGPGEFQPKDASVYSTIAFRYVPAKGDAGRFAVVCKGVFRAWRNSSDAKEGVADDSIVTVWPVATEKIAESLNDGPSCEEALRNIDLQRSRVAMNHVRSVDGVGRLKGDGPFLIAWSKNAGKVENLLFFDLSGVTTVGQADRTFNAWSLELRDPPGEWRSPVRWPARLRRLGDYVIDFLD